MTPIVLHANGMNLSVGAPEERGGENGGKGGRRISKATGSDKCHSAALNGSGVTLDAAREKQTSCHRNEKTKRECQGGNR